VSGSDDLRGILSRNIRAARKALHITQEKLAEYADISLPYMTDIERCRTWVSDKTLINIAKALNIEVFQLLMPVEIQDSAEESEESRRIHKIADLIDATMKGMRKTTDKALGDLLAQIIRLYSAELPHRKKAGSSLQDK
jgi:transcriptional regulator with XRE-family HTH domain